LNQNQTTAFEPTLAQTKRRSEFFFVAIVFCFKKIVSVPVVTISKNEMLLHWNLSGKNKILKLPRPGTSNPARKFLIQSPQTETRRTLADDDSCLTNPGQLPDSKALCARLYRDCRVSYKLPRAGRKRIETTVRRYANLLTEREAQLPENRRYSFRKASIGSIFAARIAG
jgi:hypothetical protein